MSAEHLAGTWVYRSFVNKPQVLPRINPNGTPKEDLELWSQYLFGQAEVEFHPGYSGSLSGTVELLMTYVENGAEFTHEYGDIDGPFYNSVGSVLGELAGLLRGEAQELYPQFSERLARVEQMTQGIGWGFGDFVADVVWQLEEQLTEE